MTFRQLLSIIMTEDGRFPTAFCSQDIPVPDFDDVSGSVSDEPEDSDIDDKQFLPVLPRKDIVPRISGDTLMNVLSGVYDEMFDMLFIVDVRYPYEYHGGHIRGAINVNTSEQFTEMFFNEPIPNAVIVIHCEMSHNRGPQMAGLFRDTDRNLNKASYPNLFYPNVYVLDGGYREFYAAHPDHCDGGYTRMIDDGHRKNGDLTRATAVFNKGIKTIEAKRRKALMETNVRGVGRTRTGPKSPRKNDKIMSPIQPCRL
jgi:M-phase inducer tyrosine phosphatase